MMRTLSRFFWATVQQRRALAALRAESARTIWLSNGLDGSAVCGYVFFVGHRVMRAVRSVIYAIKDNYVGTFVCTAAAAAAT